MLRLKVRLASGLVELHAGEVLSVPNNVGYADTPDDNVIAIEELIRSGMPWREAVHSRILPVSAWLDRCVTHPDRDLFVRDLPLASSDRVLDIGAGWGQLAIPLAHRVPVCAVEPSRSKSAFQRAVAEQEHVLHNLWLVNSDYHGVSFPEAFSVAILNGVLEWVGRFSSGDPCLAQRRFLEKVYRELAPGGRCIIGIENRIGLKYLLGAPDDHIGVSMVAVYDRYRAAHKYCALTGRELRTFTYTMAEYSRLLTSAGFEALEFFAVYPDYKIPSLILPVRDPEALNGYFLSGGYIAEHSGLDGSDLPIQEELRSMYVTLAELNISQHFAPSYYIVAYRGASSQTQRQSAVPLDSPVSATVGANRALILRASAQSLGETCNIEATILANCPIPSARVVVRSENSFGQMLWEYSAGPYDLDAGEVYEWAIRPNAPTGRCALTVELVTGESGAPAVLDRFPHAGTIRMEGGLCPLFGGAVSGSVELRRRPEFAAVYRVGEPIFFAANGNADSYRLDGWSSPEDWACWTDGTEAGLLLRFSEPLQQGELELVAEVHPFCPRGRLGVTVVANGVPIEEWRFDVPEEQEVHARIPAPGPLLHLVFRIDGALSPADLHLSDDRRSLGLAFKRLTCSQNRLPPSSGTCPRERPPAHDVPPHA